MALKAGYVGIKRFLADKLRLIPDKVSLLETYEVVAGVKNFCKQFDTVIKYGVTFTVNANGEIGLSGTATQQTDISSDFTLPKGVYIVSGAPAGSSSGSYDVYVQNMTSLPATTIARSYDGSNVTKFTINSDNTPIRVNCRVPAGAMDTTKVFKPMIRLADDPDSSYVPYAATNRELSVSASDQKTAINAIITAATGAADFAAFKTAMAAISPVTRSAAPDTREASPEVIEDDPEPVTKTTKSSTKKTTTTKEGE